MSEAAPPREQWGSRIGLILAMAGNAVGLGNFLRFPNQLSQNGGGTFMIPYFIAFVLVGIPLMWIEWGVGRHGGAYGEGSIPGMFDRLWKNPVAKYLGVLGLFMPLIVLIYYCYIESWTLAWTVFSITGATRGLDQAGMRQFLASYQDLNNGTMHGFWVPFVFFFITIFVNFAVVKRGLSAGIERLAKIGMPILFIFAAILVVRVLTLPTHVVAGQTVGPWQGLDWMYSPDWSALNKPSVWLAAAGQIFFTLSVGMGSLQAYASYLTKKDDIVLSGLATAATNETAEVVLGGSLAIPAIITFFGVAGTVAIAKGGTFDLGFVAMPLVFNQLPGGAIMSTVAGVMWFGLLFFAGITSSVAMATPTLSFMEEHFGWSRGRSAWTIGAIAVLLGLCHIVWYTGGFLAEWDYWAGTFGLVILALIETILFMWVFGPENAWRELHEGAQIRIPRFFRPIMTYVTPLFLVVMMIWWTIKEAIPTLEMVGVPLDQHGVRTASRLVMLAILVAQLILIKVAWSRKARRQTAAQQEAA
ncbi:MAG TPA: sodium-dependent transporter [Gemmatimonadales bacterium]|nr:sodium-dependent transporter [Gemmatimonadales bacterium]